MRTINEGDREGALRLVDRGHASLVRDRSTLDEIRAAIGELTAAPVSPRHDGLPWTVGELAHWLGVTPATLRAWEHAGILGPARDPSGSRWYDADDVRDAEMAHLLRRGGYGLLQIGGVIRQVRIAGGAAELAAALGDWQQRLTDRGLAMLTAAARLDEYLRTLDAVRQG